MTTDKKFRNLQNNNMLAIKFRTPVYSMTTPLQLTRLRGVAKLCWCASKHNLVQVPHANDILRHVKYARSCVVFIIKA